VRLLVLFPRNWRQAACNFVTRLSGGFNEILYISWPHRRQLLRLISIHRILPSCHTDVTKTYVPVFKFAHTPDSCLMYRLCTGHRNHAHQCSITLLLPDIFRYSTEKISVSIPDSNTYYTESENDKKSFNMAGNNIQESHDNEVN
jgi:hypothetical protein